MTSVALLNEAIRSDVECFVFTSSIAAYGEYSFSFHTSAVLRTVVVLLLLTYQPLLLLLSLLLLLLESGPAQTPMIETTIPEPEDAYGIAKYAFELDLKSAHHIFGIDYIIFRPHNGE